MLQLGASHLLHVRFSSVDVVIQAVEVDLRLFSFFALSLKLLFTLKRGIKNVRYEDHSVSLEKRRFIYVKIEKIWESNGMGVIEGDESDRDRLLPASSSGSH